MSSRKLPQQQPLMDQSGAVILFLAIVLPVILALAAFAIDIGFAAATREQSEHFARLATLAALEGYTQTACTQPVDSKECDEEKSLAGFSRAKEASQNNFILSSPNAEDQLDFQDSSKVTLQRGQWATLAAACAPRTAPCFIPHIDGTVVNAYRLQGMMYSPFSTKLASRIFGTPTLDVSVLATAALVPREGMLLIDNSRSVVRETHVSWIPDSDPALVGPTNNEGQEYAYFLSALNPNYPRNYHDVNWEWLTKHLTSRGSDSPSTNSKIHYADDYQVHWTYADSDYANLPESKLHPSPNLSDPTNIYNASKERLYYEVDSYRDPGISGYQGPEPLSRIFLALHSLLTRFDEQKIQGDKAGLIFYDQRLSWPRVVKLTDNFNYLKHLTNLNNEGGTNDRDEIIRHGLFPTYNAYTNTPAALAEAYKEFSESAAYDPTAKSRFILLFGDGLSNCACDKLDKDCELNCDNTYSAYRNSMSQIVRMVENQLSQNNIPIHVILTGEYVAPHTLDIEKPNAPGSCYSDTEYRALVGNPNPFGFVLGGDASGAPYKNEDEWSQAFLNMDTVHPFYEANKDLYQLAALTQGLWVPLRPPAPRDELGKCLPAPCKNNTRRLLDDRCRTIEDQMSEAVNRIMGERPYMMVEAE